VAVRIRTDLSSDGRFSQPFIELIVKKRLQRKLGACSDRRAHQCKQDDLGASSRARSDQALGERKRLRRPSARGLEDIAGAAQRVDHRIPADVDLLAQYTRTARRCWIARRSHSSTPVRI